MSDTLFQALKMIQIMCGSRKFSQDPGVFFFCSGSTIQYFDLNSKFQVGLKSLLRQGLSEPDFYGDLVYKLKKIVGSNNFSAQFIKIISHYKKIGYNINVLQQTACLVVNPITVGNFAFLFNCTPVGRTSDSMMVPT